jgi:hypothetical protein
MRSAWRDSRPERQRPRPQGCVWVFAMVLVSPLVLIPLGLGLWPRFFPDATLIIPTHIPTFTLLPSPSATFTPDAWESTGTAIVLGILPDQPTPTPSPDYCWWLTPTSTATATLPYTPDAWQSTGTAIFWATNPPQTPTAPPPRELCPESQRWTPTFTPFPLTPPDWNKPDSTTPFP